jgi:predicted lipoprotein with Yx(FWY)xxD motif
MTAPCRVTYNGWSLYYFFRDAKPGDANGQDSRNVWFVVGPDGGPIQTDARVTLSDHPDLGSILADRSGRTMYLFTNDESNVSNCSGGCARAWPPLLTVGAPQTGDGVNAASLATIERDDGSMQGDL